MFKTKTTINDEGLKKLQRKMQELSGERKVPLTEMMPDVFIQKYTDFDTLQAMLDASGIENPDEIKSEAFSQFVAEHSRFNGWEEMLKRAGVEYSKRQLGL